MVDNALALWSLSSIPLRGFISSTESDTELNHFFVEKTKFDIESPKSAGYAIRPKTAYITTNLCP